MKTLRIAFFLGWLLLTFPVSAQTTHTVQKPVYPQNTPIYTPPPSFYASVPPTQPIWGNPILFPSLQGKVVYIEYWGIHCGPCRAVFPKLVECQEKYASSGKFVVIGCHLQGMSDEVTAFLREKECNFTNYQDYRCPSAIPDGTWLPQAFLLDHTGKLVEKGHPDELLAKVEGYVTAAKKASLQDFSPARFSPCDGLEMSESFKNLPGYFTPDRSWGEIMQKLDDLGKPRNGKAGNAEAARLHTRITAAIERRTDEILAMRGERPALAAILLARLAKNLDGMPQQKRVKEALIALKTDPEVMELVKIRQEPVKLLRAKVVGIPPQKMGAATKIATKNYLKLKKFAEEPRRSKAVLAETRGLMKLLMEEFS